MNLHRGFKRIVWILSVSGAVAWWIVAFSSGDFRSGINPEGIKRIDVLDKIFLHFSGQERGAIGLSELRNQSERKIGQAQRPSENPQPADYLFIWLQETHPTLNVELLKLRYLSVPDTIADTTLWGKAIYASPEEFFTNKIFYGRIATAFFSGFIPFIGIWLIWFLVIWIIRGFTS